MLRCVCLAGLAAFWLGCNSSLSEYRCASSEECVGASAGRCEPGGYCSFADESCPDGFRFGEASGSESGECVVETLVDAGTPDGPQSVWLSRHRLDFNNVAHDEDLIDFPVLVVLTPDRVDYSLMQAGGQDLRFTSPAGDRLPYEIEHWDPAGSSYLWVKPQQIDAMVDSDHIYLHYNNVLATAEQNAAQVWSSGYEAVYHFAESGDLFENSVGPGNPGNNAGTEAAPGAIGSGRLFDGAATHIKLNNHTAMDMLQGVAGMTITAWIQPSDLSGQQGIVSVGSAGQPCGNRSRATILKDDGPPDELLVAGRARDDEPLALRSTSDVNLVTDSWYLVSSIFDVDFDHGEDATFPFGRVQVLVNDTVHLTRTVRMAQAATDITQSPCGTIGAQDDAGSDFFNGLIDEVRISGVDRSPVWLQAQYQSMQDNDFVRFGPAEEVQIRLDD